MRPNKSILYVLPFIKGWSVSADLPLNCYSKTDKPNQIILVYKKGDAIHNDGTLLKTIEDEIYVTYDIDEIFIDDFCRVLSGKYSQISDMGKDILLSRAPTQVDYNVMSSILNKSKKYKKYLEKKLGIKNIDEYVDEYESKFGNEEFLSFADERCEKSPSI